MVDIIPNLSVSTARPSEGSSNLLLSDQTFSWKPNHPFQSCLSNPGKWEEGCEEISVSMIDMDGRSVCCMVGLYRGNITYAKRDFYRNM